MALLAKSQRKSAQEKPKPKSISHPRLYRGALRERVRPVRAGGGFGKFEIKRFLQSKIGILNEKVLQI